VRGSHQSGGYYLASPKGKIIADMVANGIFKINWKPEADEFLAGTKTYAESWMLHHIADIRTVLTREAVRRMFLFWLRDIGFEDTGIPSLYQASLAAREGVETIIDALPEATWTLWEAREV